MKSIWSYLPQSLGGIMGDNISPYWTVKVETLQFSTKPIERIWQVLDIAPLDQKTKLPKLKREQRKSEAVKKGELLLQITLPRQAKITETGIDFTRTRANRLRSFIDESLRISTKLVFNFPTEYTLVKGDASVRLRYSKMLPK